MTSSRESRRGFQSRESELFPGGGGGSGFSASNSGVRLSLFTASSLRAGGHEGADDVGPSRRYGLMEQRRAVGRLRVRIGAGIEQHLECFALIAVRRFAVRRSDQSVESRSGSERGATAAVIATIAAVLPTLPLPRPPRTARVVTILLLFDLCGSPIDFRSVLDHQLEHFDVGRNRRAEERRRVVLF